MRPAMPDSRPIATLEPHELWQILSQLKPNVYEFVHGKQKLGVRKKGSFMMRHFRTVAELEDFIKSAEKNPARAAEDAAVLAAAPEPPPPREDVSKALWALREQIRRLEEINDELRAKGKKVVADRDNWERRAKELEKEIAGLRTAARRAQSGPASANQKIKRVKVAFAKLCHPNNIRAAGYEASIRAEIFKEFWEQLERIEADT